MNIVWCAKNLNHYKIDLLNELCTLPNVVLQVYYSRETNIESKRGFECWLFKTQLALLLKLALNSKGAWVMIPFEKKWIFPLLVSRIIGLRIFTYTHGYIHKEGKLGKINSLLSSYFIRYYDAIIFYTKSSMEECVKKYDLNSRISYANNTLRFDINKIDSLNIPRGNGILFVGRINLRKRINELMIALRNINADMEIPLHIVGPVENDTAWIFEEQKNIYYHGSLYEEQDIRRVASQCKFFCIPGRSGLGIVHSFALGLPFITTGIAGHGPEISYVVHTKNGWIFPEGKLEEGLRSILDITDDEYGAMLKNIKDTCQSITIRGWAEQVYGLLTDEN